jgi:hypothetical protein
MVDLTFIEKRSGNLLLYIIVIAIVLFLLFMVWPWRYALILTLWGAYVLWWPTVWLEKLHSPAGFSGPYRSHCHWCCSGAGSRQRNRHRGSANRTTRCVSVKRIH